MQWGISFLMIMRWEWFWILNFQADRMFWGKRLLAYHSLRRASMPCRRRCRPLRLIHPRSCSGQEMNMWVCRLRVFFIVKYRMRREKRTSKKWDVIELCCCNVYCVVTATSYLFFFFSLLIMMAEEDCISTSLWEFILWFWAATSDTYPPSFISRVFRAGSCHFTDRSFSDTPLSERMRAAKVLWSSFSSVRRGCFRFPRGACTWAPGRGWSFGIWRKLAFLAWINVVETRVWSEMEI